MDPQESNDLLASKEWHRLTDNQQKIAFVWFTTPWLSRKAVAEKVGCSLSSVQIFFNSDSFRELSMELSRYEFKELVYMAIKSLKECLLDRDAKVKLAAAIRVLETEGILGITKDIDKNITIKWKDGNRDQLSAAPLPAPSPQ